MAADQVREHDDACFVCHESRRAREPRWLEPRCVSWCASVRWIDCPACTATLCVPCYQRMLALADASATRAEEGKYAGMASTCPWHHSLAPVLARQAPHTAPQCLMALTCSLFMGATSVALAALVVFLFVTTPTGQ